jgi:uncharacterized cupin superfamily protein
MRRINISAPKFEYTESDPEGFRSGMARLGKTLGAKQTGISVYELPPGQSICPYHYEHGEEEWLLVLEGTPTLRTPEGESVLDPWDVVCFPVGPEGAHGVHNATEETVRVLMFGNVVVPTVSVYPDSDKIGVWTRDNVDDLIVRRESGVEYFDREAGGAGQESD